MSNIFFSNFPVVDYWIGSDAPTRIRHIMPRFKLVDLVGNNSGNYDIYRMTDGDTLESVAQLVYGDARWYWVLALYNNISDPYESLPISNSDLIARVKEVYGDDKVNAVHHYEDDIGNECGQYADGSPQPVTNFQYEDRLNTEKRKIKIPNSKYLQNFQQMLEDVTKDL